MLFIRSASHPYHAMHHIPAHPATSNTRASHSTPLTLHSITPPHAHPHRRSCLITNRPQPQRGEQSSRMFTYTYTYTHVHMCAHTCTYLPVQAHTHAYTSTYTCRTTHKHIHTHSQARTHIYTQRDARMRRMRCVTAHPP